MIKSIYIILLFFHVIITINALGKTEAQYRNELEKHPITVLPVSLSGGVTYDYLFIQTNKVILAYSTNLIEIDLLTNERKIIDIPQELTERNFRSFRELKYDHIRNTVHMVFGRRLFGSVYIWSYFILNLENYSWEEIEELEGNVKRQGILLRSG